MAHGLPLAGAEILGDFLQFAVEADQAPAHDHRDEREGEGDVGDRDVDESQRPGPAGRPADPPPRGTENHDYENSVRLSAGAVSPPAGRKYCNLPVMHRLPLADYGTGDMPRKARYYYVAAVAGCLCCGRSQPSPPPGHPRNYNLWVVGWGRGLATAEYKTGRGLVQVPRQWN